MDNQAKQSGLGYFNLKQFSPVVRFLTITDIFLNSGLGLITPIFAVYVADGLPGGNVEVVGIASSIFLLTKSLVQIPVGALIDKMKGERDDYWFLLSGVFVYASIPLLYIIVKSPAHLYLVQFVFGVGAAFAYPTWMAIFTRHIDRQHEGVEWSVYATLVEFVMAFSAVIGGFIAYRYGFNILFVMASILIFLSNLFVLSIYNIIKK